MTSRSHSLLNALDAHRVEVTARLDALPESIVHAVPSPGAWSLAQLAEHILRIDGGLQIDASPAPLWVRATSPVRSRLLCRFLSLPIRIPAPPSAAGVMPSAEPRWADVRQRWAVMRARWRSALERPEVVAYRHPILGPFLLEDALAFLLAHHRHHDAQIRRTLTALGQHPDGSPIDGTERDLPRTTDALNVVA